MYDSTYLLSWKLLRFTLTVFEERRHSNVLVIFFPKRNQFTCDKMFITFAQMGQAFIQAVLLMSVFEQRLNFWKLYSVRRGHEVL